jgi:hypothetical protein
MTNTRVGAMAAVVACARAARGSVADFHSDRSPNAKPSPMIRKLALLNDEAVYWALRTYIRVLKAIGDISELTTDHKRGKNR